MKKVIVTGANGFIGSHLLRLLSEKGISTIAVVKDRQEQVGHICRLPGVRIVYCELDRIGSLPALVADRDIDTCFHLAWAGSFGELRADYALQLENVRYALDTVNAVSSMGVRRFVGAGTLAEKDVLNYHPTDGARPNPVSMYGIAKICMHYMTKTECTRRGMEHIWCYLSNTFGVGNTTNNFVNMASRKMLNGERAAFTTGEQVYDFVYITDTVKAIFAAAERGRSNTSYYLGSTTPRKLKDYISIIRDTINPGIELHLGEVPFNGIPLDASDYDASKLERDTGFIPDVPFEEGIVKTIQWLKSEQLAMSGTEPRNSVSAVIITGADGFVGSYTVMEFLRHGIKVLAVDVVPRPKRLGVHPGLSYVQCDISDTAALKSMIPANVYDTFIHFAWAGSAGNDRTDYNLQMRNALTAVECLKVAKEAGCTRFICAGSIMEYEVEAAIHTQGSRPGMGYIYGMGKQIAHNMCKSVAVEIGIDLMWPMITNAYGVGELSPRFVNTTLRRIIAGEPLQFTAATQNYDFIYVSDVAHAFYLVAIKGKPFCEYMIGSGNARPLKEFILEMVEACSPGMDTVFGDIPYTGTNLPLSTFSTKAIEQDCGFNPKVSFKDGAMLTMEWLKTQL